MTERLTIHCAAVLFVLFFLCTPNARASEPVRGTVAVFYIPTLSMENNAIAMQARMEILDVFNRLGRFLPVEQNRLDHAAGGQARGADVDYTALAQKLNCSIYVTLSITRQGRRYYAVLDTVSLRKEYGHLASRITVRSDVAPNIPLKLAREIVYLHKDLVLYAACSHASRGMIHLEAGQWHGLVPGRVKTASAKLDVVKTSRYRSLARISGMSSESEQVEIKIYPDIKPLLREIEKRIDVNTVFAYSVEPEKIKNDNPDKRFVKGFCLINPAVSLILPGYGSYLATGYLGVKQKKMSIPNVVVSIALVFTQLTLTEMMTDFKSNFFPWNRDSDKSIAVQNLHIFCWSTLLTTYSVSFLDQLAYQYNLAKKLPSSFEHRDLAAAGLSLVVPGGGLFYKGHRIAGWSFYFAEMILAGYGAYSTGVDDNYKYAFGALALVKAVDIICAYLLSPTYSFYNMEKERQASRTGFSLNIVPDHQGNSITALSLTRKF